MDLEDLAGEFGSGGGFVVVGCLDGGRLRLDVALLPFLQDATKI